MANATLKPDARFDDPTAWDESGRTQPVFMAHEAWAYTDKDGKMIVKDGLLHFAAVSPGAAPPAGTKQAYKIDRGDLDNLKAALTRRTESGLPLPMFIGHRRPTAPETEQPPLVGYGVGAELMDHPVTRDPILSTKRFIRKGATEKYKVNEYPHASPEFDPVTGEITAIALLKNEPKLAMPMVVGYQKEGQLVAAHYSFGFDDFGPTTPPEVKDDKEKTDPTDPPDQDAIGDDPKQASDAKAAFELLMKVPTFAEMVNSFEASKAPPPAQPPEQMPAAPMDVPPGAQPAGGAPDLPPVQMKKDTAMSAQYQKQIADLQAENRKLHAERLLQDAKEKGVLFTYSKELATMTALPTNEARESHLQHMLTHYKQDEAKALIAAAPDVKTKSMLASEPEAKPELAGESLARSAAQYCKANKLDAANDDHWMQAIEAIKARRKAS